MLVLYLFFHISFRFLKGLFEQFLDPDELLKAFTSSDPVQVESLSTCFSLLKIVVSDPAYKAYLPMVIMLCHIVCPALQSLPNIRIEFRTASYELLLSILNHHWSYFFKYVIGRSTDRCFFSH